MGKLEGKIALVTGGNGGIGLATAERLIAEGAHVYVTGRRQAQLDEAVQGLGPNATGVQGDVSNLEDLDRLYDTIRREKERLDIVFANAGVASFARLGEITEAQFDREFGINVKGLLFTVQKALPLMGAGGSIILNSSIVGTKGIENFSVYSATKAAVRSFARTWTSDLKGTGIRVNVVSPGPISTPGADGLTDDPTAFKEGMASAVPLGRVGDADEIARVVAFLASDDASYIAGIDLVVDGGLAQI